MAKLPGSLQSATSNGSRTSSTIGGFFELSQARAAFLQVLDDCTLAEVVGNRAALEVLLAG
jgi:hypothetical protein